MDDREIPHIDVIAVSEEERRRLRLPQRVQAKLFPLGRGLRRCRVAFADADGPKGGPATRCTIDVQIAHLRPLHAEGRATSRPLALQDALSRLKWRIARVLAASRVRRRHPGKSVPAAREASL